MTAWAILDRSMGRSESMRVHIAGVALSDLPDLAEAMNGQQLRHLRRGKEGEPRLAAFRRHRGHLAHVTLGCRIPQIAGEHEVGYELGPRSERAKLGKHRADRDLGQIHHHAEPAHEGWPGWLESVADQPQRERVRGRVHLEIGRHEGDPAGGGGHRRCANRCQPLPLPVLGCQMINLKESPSPSPRPAGHARSSAT